MRKLKILFSAITALLFIAIILIVAREISALEHSGETHGNETWLKHESPHIVKDNFIITQEDELVIEGGCVIEFEEDASLSVLGNLIVNGRINDNVFFTSLNSTQNNGFWKGIEFTENGTGTMEFCNIKYSEKAIFGNNPKGEYLIISNSEISNSSEYGIFFVDSKNIFIFNNITSKNDFSLYFENSNAILTNFSAGVNNVDITLQKNSNITARDINFYNILFENGESKLIRQWQLDIEVIDGNSESIQDSYIVITKNEENLYKGVTDKFGLINYLYLTEYTQISDGLTNEIIKKNPYFIIAQKDNLKKDVTFNITKSTKITITLKQWNHVPTIRLLYPSDNIRVLKESITLWWYGEDLDNEYLEYKVYYRKAGKSFIESDWQKYQFFKLENLVDKQKYYWKVMVQDKEIQVESETRSFYVNIKTYEPEIFLESPIDNSIINTTSVILTWNAFDKDGDNLTYDVYYDYWDASQIISENQTGTVFYLSGLIDKGKYFWKIVVSDGENQVSSEILSFSVKFDTEPDVEPPIIEPPINNDDNNTIINNSPPKITLLSPKNNIKIIDDSIILKYSGNDANEDELTYDIYMDTNDASTLIIQSYKGIEYLIENLEDGKTYYWKVIVKDKESTDTSLTWSFSVEFSDNSINEIDNVEKPADDEIINIDTKTAAIGSTLIISTLFAYLVSTENGKHHLLKMLAIPLYTRLKKDKILMNDYRTKMYVHIKENPGVHLRSLMTNFNIKNGAAIHHLTMLERNEYIKSIRDGSYRRYYPKEFQILNKPLDIQKMIINEIEKNPGIIQKDIATSLNISRQVAGYHIEKLKENKFISFKKDGKINKYYICKKDPKT